MSFLYIDLSRKGKQKEKNVSNKKSATSTEHLNGKCIQHDQPKCLNMKRNFLIMGLFCCQIQLTRPQGDCLTCWPEYKQADLRPCLSTFQPKCPQNSKGFQPFAKMPEMIGKFEYCPLTGQYMVHN